MYKMLLKIFARMVLFFFGWGMPDYEWVKGYHGDLVLTIGHTTYWDYVFGVLYSWAAGVGHRCRFIMSGGVARELFWAEPFFRWSGCIYVSDKEKRNAGNLETIVEKLRNDGQKNKIIFIAPNGSITGGEWRTGWYYLGKMLNARIGCVGVHFHPFDRNIRFTGGLMDPEQVSLEEGTRLMKTWMGEIYPKFPKNSSVPVSEKTTVNRRPITDWHTLAVDPVVFSTLPLFIAAGWCWSEGKGDLAWGGAVSAFCRAMYHRSYERSSFWYFADVVSAVSVILWWIFRAWCADAAVCMPFLVVVASCWLVGAGRHSHPLRTKKYIVFHTLWHLMMAAFVIWWCKTNALSDFFLQLKFSVADIKDEL